MTLFYYDIFTTFISNYLVFLVVPQILSKIKKVKFYLRILLKMQIISIKLFKF